MTIGLDPGQLLLLDGARRATLATLAPDGRARLVPCCFALVEWPGGQTIVTPIDAKPKRSSDARQLARVRDVERDPRVTLLVDHWDEDWARLWWLRVDGDARVLWPTDDDVSHASAVAALRARYAQYATHDLEARPVIAIRPIGTRSWLAAETVRRHR